MFLADRNSIKTNATERNVVQTTGCRPYCLRLCSVPNTEFKRISRIISRIIRLFICAILLFINLYNSTMLILIRDYNVDTTK